MKTEKEIIEQLRNITEAINYELKKVNVSMVRVNMYAGEIYSLLWALDVTIENNDDDKDEK